LLLVWLWATNTVTEAVEHSFDSRLVSLVDALVAATGTEQGHPYLIRPVSEPRFDQPLSGAYFQIEGPGGSLLASRSLGDQLLPASHTSHPGLSIEDIRGPRGQHLRAVERDFVPPDRNEVVHILVALSQDESLQESARVRRLFGLGFTLIGVGLVGAVVFQVSWGLRGLLRLRGIVEQLRAGGELISQVALPVEVQPLLAEIEALVQQNRATVERARSHVGNLAHALRTRLSIIRNAVASADQVTALHELLGAERLVQHHLVRARTAALAGTTASDISVAAVANELARALRRLFAERRLLITVIGDCALRVRSEREDLAEMLGNLMENACKWTEAQVNVSVHRNGAWVIAVVSDDGPGLPAQRLREVRERGVRLDETVPGSGLGLAIAADLAALYGGRVDLSSPGPDGGLAAELYLPAAQALAAA
jgi:signal transduction histidine kinase